MFSLTSVFIHPTRFIVTCKFCHLNFTHKSVKLFFFSILPSFASDTFCNEKYQDLSQSRSIIQSIINYSCHGIQWCCKISSSLITEKFPVINISPKSLSISSSLHLPRSSLWWLLVYSFILHIKEDHVVLTFLYLVCLLSQNVPQSQPCCTWFYCFPGGYFATKQRFFFFSKPEWCHIMYDCYIICAHESRVGHLCGVCVEVWESKAALCAYICLSHAEASSRSGFSYPLDRSQVMRLLYCDSSTLYEYFEKCLLC